jgi:SAM-dependent methyltransferase
MFLKGSILRRSEYQAIARYTLDGSVLDLGGSRASGYQELFQGSPTWTVVNYGDTHPGADLIFNIEEKFPLEDKSYDHVVTMNVLEHIFEYQNVFSEVSRVLKAGGLFISTVPFIHHIHGSPDDYHRYTESTFRKLAAKYNFDMVSIEPLGFGLFSLLFQTIGGSIPFAFFRGFVGSSCITLDKILLSFGRFQRLQKIIPLGYCWVMKKK